jgi:hypothetical protein
MSSSENGMPKPLKDIPEEIKPGDLVYLDANGNYRRINHDVGANRAIAGVAITGGNNPLIAITGTAIHINQI